METKLIEATQNVKDGPNHGKFLVGRFRGEWAVESAVDLATEGLSRSLLSRCGWSASHLLVLDLQTGEGAVFAPGGWAHADLDKHRIWVCPLYEPFLEWLYKQDLRNLQALPSLVELPEAEFMLARRRLGEATG